LAAQFDNLNARGSIPFAISAATGHVYQHLLDPAGNPIGNWSLTAPGAFLDIAGGTYGPDRAPMVFGLSINHQIYGAKLTRDGRLASGWFLVAPGYFDGMSVGTYGPDGASIVFGPGSAAGNYQASPARLPHQANPDTGC